MTAFPLQARSPDRPLIRLHCPDAATQGLCREIVQALAETAGPAGPVIRQVGPADTTPTRSGDIGVTLQLGGDDPSGGATGSALSGHLEWQQGQQNPQTGPELRLELAGGDATPDQLARFARDLIQATPEFAAVLRAPPDG